ncbi:MAG: putative acetolactate synthase small subunit [Firmicutes bacterium ADurb.Bin080]|jgi:acetolactate synthase I/III small subunit|nr:acetolactate synthase small subunit [Clostridiales bacterium]OQC11859.1 MAG: putative acetolactate synthase small subunit [Firmicutes bacterium ADurb.Bin080]
MKEEKFLMSMLVKNEAGVLTRVSGLFARRGFNIDSLSVGETLDPKISRITITATGDDYVKEQIRLQLEKLHDVIIVKNMDMKNTVMRELMLIKVNVPQGKRIEILEATTIFRAKVVDLTPDSLTLEVTGDTNKCNAFLEYMVPFGVVELCRTGLTAIGRGKDLLLGEQEANSEE